MSGREDAEQYAAYQTALEEQANQTVVPDAAAAAAQEQAGQSMGADRDDILAGALAETAFPGSVGEAADQSMVADREDILALGEAQERANQCVLPDSEDVLAEQANILAEATSPIIAVAAQQQADDGAASTQQCGEQEPMTPVPEGFYSSAEGLPEAKVMTTVRDDFHSSDTGEAVAAGSVDLATSGEAPNREARDNADLLRFMERYHDYRTGHVPLDLGPLQYRDFRQLVQLLEQDPAFRELYGRYEMDRRNEIDRYMNEVIIDEHGHVGPRREVEQRDWQEWKRAQMSTLTSAGPAALIGMVITYVRTGDVDRAIEVADKLKPFDALAKGASGTARGIEHPQPVSDPAAQGAIIRPPPDRGDPGPPDQRGP